MVNQQPKTVCQMPTLFRISEKDDGIDEFTGWVQILNRSCVSIFKVEVSVNNKQDQELICTAKMQKLVCTD